MSAGATSIPPAMKPAMYARCARRNELNPATNRSGSSIRKTSPARLATRAATNHIRTADVDGSIANAAAINKIITAGLVAHSSRRRPVATANQLASAVTPVIPRSVTASVLIDPTLAGRSGPTATISPPPRALSSAEERCLHTAEVTGSNPVAPTTERPGQARVSRIWRR